MLSILVFILVTALLVADAVIFFTVGYAYAGKNVAEQLKKAGWTIEPPDKTQRSSEEI